MNLGNLCRSISFSNTVVVFLIPSETVDARSNTPMIGFVTTPTIPFPKPLKNPPNPSFSAP